MDPSQVRFGCLQVRTPAECYMSLALCSMSIIPDFGGEADCVKTDRVRQFRYNPLPFAVGPVRSAAERGRS
jgi:hypothetical protein